MDKAKIFISLLLLTVLLSGDVSAAMKTNDKAPEFSLSGLEGKQYSIAHFIRSKNNAKSNGFVLAFFASWCMPCRHELPVLNGIADELSSKGIKIVLINVKEDAETVRELLASLNVQKPAVLLDKDGNTAQKYQVRFLPITFFVNREGRIADILFGEISDEDDVRKSTEKLLY